MKFLSRNIIFSFLLSLPFGVKADTISEFPCSGPNKPLIQVTAMLPKFSITALPESEIAARFITDRKETVSQYELSHQVIIDRQTQNNCPYRTINIYFRITANTYISSEKAQKSPCFIAAVNQVDSELLLTYQKILATNGQSLKLYVADGFSQISKDEVKQSKTEQMQATLTSLAASASHSTQKDFTENHLSNRDLKLAGAVQESCSKNTKED